jgi:two-component sensor histidine kinase
MDRIDRLFGIIVSRGWRIGVVTGMVSLFLAIAVRIVLGSHLQGFPFITFWPAMMITALVGGWRIASVTSVLALLYGWYALIPPAFVFSLTRNDAIGLSVGAVVAGAIIVLSEIVRAAARRLKSEQVRALNLLAERDVMFSELQHRVANNMQFVAGLLTLQGRRLTPGSLERQVFKESADRLSLFASVHRKLHDAPRAQTGFADLTADILRDLLKATGCGTVELTVTADPVDLPLDMLATLVLIATEATTNSIKHVFAARQGATLKVSLSRTAKDQCELRVADDGPGFPVPGQKAESTSLGMHILHSLAARIDGTVSLESSNGAIVRVSFPVPAAIGS